MKLTAYTYAGPWRVWEDVRAWFLDGPTLVLHQGRTKGSMTRETVPLSREVIGLADDSPVRHVSDSRAAQYRPDPVKVERQERREARERPRGATLRIPDREPARARFGDSPRRRQYRGDGS